MVIRGDLVELSDDRNDPNSITKEIDTEVNVQWKFNGDDPIPIKILVIINYLPPTYNQAIMRKYPHPYCCISIPSP